LTRRERVNLNSGGSLTIYFDAKQPGMDNETSWVPASEGAFSLYLRCCWSEKAILDVVWALPNVKRVKWN